MHERVVATRGTEKIELEFVGIQKGFGPVSDQELYNLLQPLGKHTIASTVSRHTIEAFGYTIG